MDKITTFLKSLIGLSTVASYVARIFILAAWFVTGLMTGAATPAGDAVGIVTSKERSLAVAAQLVNETPKPEIVEAVRTQTGSPAEVVSTVENIKPNESPNVTTAAPTTN